jgi:hypothetical protein
LSVEYGHGYVAPKVGQRVLRQDSTIVVQTTHFDDAALERNKQIRNAGLIDKGKMALHENEDIRMVISCPDTMQWTMFKRAYPDIYKLILSKDESERVSGCRKLQILHPEWVVQERL